MRLYKMLAVLMMIAAPAMAQSAVNEKPDGPLSFVALRLAREQMVVARQEAFEARKEERQARRDQRAAQRAALDAQAMQQVNQGRGY